jgi:hypothetical protein
MAVTNRAKEKGTLPRELVQTSRDGDSTMRPRPPFGGRGSATAGVRDHRASFGFLLGSLIRPSSFAALRRTQSGTFSCAKGGRRLRIPPVPPLSHFPLHQSQHAFPRFLKQLRWQHPIGYACIIAFADTTQVWSGPCEFVPFCQHNP